MSNKVAEQRLPWVVGTWNPYTWPSPWPYTVAQVRLITETYRVKRLED